jgi:hypothetical protein
LGKKKQEKVCIMDLSPLLACLQRLQMLFFFFLWFGLVHASDDFDWHNCSCCIGIISGAASESESEFKSDDFNRF